MSEDNVKRNSLKDDKSQNLTNAQIKKHKNNEKRIKKGGSHDDLIIPSKSKQFGLDGEKGLKKRSKERSSVNESILRKAESSDSDSSEKEKVEPLFQINKNSPRLYFKVVECKDVSEKPKNYYVSVFINQKRVYQSSTSKKTNEWSDEGRIFSIENAESIVINLVSKGILSTIKGSTTLNLNDLIEGYPYNRWFKLDNKKGDNRSLHLLIQKIPPNKQLSPLDFTYPLHQLIRNNNYGLFEECIDEEFSDIYKEDERGYSCLHLAVELNLIKFVKLILKKMDKNRYKSLVTKKGESPLHIACENKCDKKMIQLLLKNGFNANAKDFQGNLPIHTSSIVNHFESIDILVSHGSKINKLNKEKNTPLACALLNHSPESVISLIKHGSNVYCKVSNNLTVWELSQRKDLVNSEPRQCFLDSLGIIDPREFINKKEYPKTKFFKSESHVSYDYLKSDQLSISVKEKTNAILLITSVDPNKYIDFPSQVAFAVVKSHQGVHHEPDFSRDAISFGGSKPLKVLLEPDYFYNIIPYSKKREFEGKFNLIVQLPEKKSCKITQLKKWKYCEVVEGKWKNKSAGGSQPNPTWIHNPQYEITFPQEECIRFMVYLSQEPDDPNLRLTEGGEHCKVPFNLNIGFYLLDRSGVKTMDQTEGWVNSRGVHKEFVIDCSQRNHCTIMPSTLNRGEEGVYTLKIYCDNPFSMKKK